MKVKGKVLPYPVCTLLFKSDKLLMKLQTTNWTANPAGFQNVISSSKSHVKFKGSAWGGCHAKKERPGSAPHLSGYHTLSFNGKASPPVPERKLRTTVEPQIGEQLMWNPSWSGNSRAFINLWKDTGGVMVVFPLCGVSAGQCQQLLCKLKTKRWLGVNWRTRGRVTALEE